MCRSYPTCELDFDCDSVGVLERQLVHVGTTVVDVGKVKVCFGNMSGGGEGEQRSFYDL